MILNKRKNKRGFVALISATVISIVLLILVTNGNLASFYSRASILDSEFKEKSYTLAEACVDNALLKFINNPNYNPLNEILYIDADTCIIESVVTNTSKIILVKADYRNSITKLQVKFNPIDMSILSWEEI